MRKIKVEVRNDILGDSIFWIGYSSDLSGIKNIPARMLAERVAKDGITRKSGMWLVSEITVGEQP